MSPFTRLPSSGAATEGRREWNIQYPATTLIARFPGPVLRDQVRGAADAMNEVGAGVVEPDDVLGVEGHAIQIGYR